MRDVSENEHTPPRGGTQAPDLVIGNFRDPSGGHPYMDASCKSIGRNDLRGAKNYLNRCGGRGRQDHTPHPGQLVSGRCSDLDTFEVSSYQVFQTVSGQALHIIHNEPRGMCWLFPLLHPIVLPLHATYLSVA